MKSPTLLKALSDPKLFAHHFKGTSWTSWKAFLAALTAAPMDEAALATYRQCTGRATAPTTPFSEACLVVGRRGGKSRVLALIAVFLACFRDYTPHLAPGEVATIAVLASNRSQARSIFRFVSGLLKAVEPLAAMIETETGEFIALSNRVVIEISTASFRTTRGYSFAAVLCDEIAFWRSDESSANPDTEILRALRPGMASIPGSILLLASSPYAKKGELYNTFRRHYGKDEARVLVWKADTATVNPRADPAIIAEAYDSDPEAAKAEYGAEFRDDLADWVTREAVDAVTMWGCRELQPETGIQYAAFCDPSGGANDAFTLAIAHLRDNSVGVLDAVLEIRPPFDPDVAVMECAALLDRFGVKRVVGDRYAGLWPVSRFAAHGVTFEQSARPKSDLYHDALPLLNSRRVELLEHQRLSAQLCGLERRTSRSGKDSIDHGPGGHDDIANAVCGVLVGLELDRRPALIKRADLLIAEQAAEHLFAALIYATLWVGVDGVCGYGIFSHSNVDPVPLIVLDFDRLPWSAAVLPQIVTRLNEQIEAALAAASARERQCDPVFVYVPDQLVDVATTAVRAVFGARIAAMVRSFHMGRVKHLTEVMTIDPLPFEDPVRLMLNAGAHVSAGRVKLSPTALARSAELPLFGSLALKPGEDVMGDVLRVAMLAAIAGLDDSPKRAEGAAVRFG
jgi:hypothetical protein